MDRVLARIDLGTWRRMVSAHRHAQLQILEARAMWRVRVK